MCDIWARYLYQLFIIIRITKMLVYFNRTSIQISYVNLLHKYKVAMIEIILKLLQMKVPWLEYWAMNVSN